MPDRRSDEARPFAVGGRDPSGARIRRVPAAGQPRSGLRPAHLALVRDDRTPPARKAVLAAAAGYLILGRDIVPDDVPIIGGLDDLVVVVLAIDLFLEGVPSDVLHEKLDELGIDKLAFEQDVAQVRRLTPKPVRRAIRQLPQAASAAGRAIRNIDLGPRARSWISREGFSA